MNQEKQKIRSFTDLNAWKEGHNLVLMVYTITKAFPKEEIFGLTNQMRRAAVSITSNIAEGFSRPSYKDKAHFYSISLGSTTELQDQLLIAKDAGFLSEKNFSVAEAQSVSVHKLLNGLIKKSKTYS